MSERPPGTSPAIIPPAGEPATVRAISRTGSGLRRLRRVLRLVGPFGPLLALVLLIVGTALVEHYQVDAGSRAFLTARNFNNILGQWSFVGIVAVGMTFVIILGGIDLSVGSMVALAGGAAVYALNAAAGRWEWGVGAAISTACIVSVVGGLIMGVLNGVTIATGRIAPFVATLGTLAIFRSLIVAPAEGSEVRSEVPAFASIGSASVPVPWLGAEGGPLGVRVSVMVFFVLAAAAHLVLSSTVFGRRVYAIGDNPVSARYAGVPRPARDDRGVRNLRAHVRHRGAAQREPAELGLQLDIGPLL